MARSIRLRPDQVKDVEAFREAFTRRFPSIPLEGMAPEVLVGLAIDLIVERLNAESTERDLRRAERRLDVVA